MQLERAERLLIERGAREIAHPGGTLLAHLRRVADLLAGWGASDDVRLAGLCHAAYGTDGFPTALLTPAERSLLAATIGTDAEQLVYTYGSYDRAAGYPRLGGAAPEFLDRFTGTRSCPGPAAVRAFADITAANELDVLRHSAAIRDRHGAQLQALMTRAAHHLSPAAAQAWSTRPYPPG